MLLPRLLAVAFLLTAVSVHSPAQDAKAKDKPKEKVKEKAKEKDKTPEVTDKQFRSALFGLLDDPNNSTAEVYAARIIKYTKDSPKVVLVIPIAERKTWISTNPGPEKTRVLLAAYLGGNALAQLNSGIKRDDPYAGLMMMFGAYHDMKSQDGSVQNDGTDELIKLHKEGRLLNYIDELLKREAKEKPTTFNKVGEKLGGTDKAKDKPGAKDKD